jgi:hypothetical protein
MIYFLHGDNLALSRLKLQELINNAKLNHSEIVNLDGFKLTLNEVVQNFESLSLFGLNKFLVIENLFTRQKSQEKDQIIKYLTVTYIELNLIFWESKTISGYITKNFPKNWIINIFKIPPEIFNFLDLISPSNNQICLKKFHLLIRTESIELIFYMIVRHVRSLIQVKDNRQSFKGSPWQLSKLIKQANSNSFNQLISFYKNLLNIDFIIKSGQSLMPLSWHLDLFIANL